MWPVFDPLQSVWAMAQVQSASHAGADALQALQQQRWQALALHTVQASPLYRAWLKGADPGRLALRDFPVVHKAPLMAAFDQWVTDPVLHEEDVRAFIADPARVGEAFLGRYAVWESSGSSGEPGLFVQDTQALAVYDALEALRRPPTTWWPWQPRIAFVGATGGHFASIVSLQRLRQLNPWLRQQLGVVSILQATAGIVAQLQAFAPTVVATYPTAAVLLAEEQRAGRLDLRLTQLWTGGETLTAGMRRTVEEAFGCQVLDSYGASECLDIGAECAHGGLHLNSDWVILESVDEAGRPVPDGASGAATLLTNLANHVQPIIRYWLGDRVTVRAERCGCGSALPLLRVQGRCDDSLRLGPPDHPVQVLPLALTTVLEDEAGLYDFQLVQRGPQSLALRTGAPAEHAHRAQRALQAYLAQVAAGPVHVTVQRDVPASLGRSGKRQRVVRLEAACAVGAASAAIRGMP